MILKPNLNATTPSLKRCRNAESFSEEHNGSGLVNPKKMRRDANSAAGVTPQVLKSNRERAQADSVSDSSCTSAMDYLKFNETDFDKSGCVDLNLERQTKSFNLVYKRRKVHKDSSCPVRESAVSRVEGADKEGLVDVYISYVTNINDFSSASYNVISTSVVTEIEDSSEFIWKECVDEQKKSGLVLEGTNYNLKPPVFSVGDIVWVKPGSRYLAWPAILINPLTDAPDAVINCCIPDALCVMYFGFSKKGKQREYAWIKHGWIFPFLENKQRFEGQAGMFIRQPDDFHIAVKEAILAGNPSPDANSGIFPPTCSRTLEKAATSNPIQESQSQVLDFHEKHKRTCDGCGLTLQLAYLRRTNGSTSQHRPLCEPCSKLHKGSRERKVRPERLPVICHGIDGIYFPYLHLVQCMCGSCHTKKITLSEWERHTGCRAKKWKCSVKVKDTMSSLGKWLAEYDELGADPSKLTSEKIFAFLQETYKPITAKWTLEKCAVCGWAEDSDENKIIVCDSCQIAVHQECYGAQNIDVTSWVCRVCETADVQRECCLCPVKGGALKPTNIDTLWVHVTCAWFRPEVGFLDDGKMEPAIGILKIPPISFLKACVICKQTHGSCIKCCKCETHFHAVCAAQAGLYMELQCHEKNGVPVTQKMVYCAFHRAPSKDNALVIHTPSGMFSATNAIQTPDKQHNIKRSRRISTQLKELPELLSSKVVDFESDSAARCRTYRRSYYKKTGIEQVFHRPTGPRYHSLSEMERLNSSRLGNLNTFSSFKERLQHLQRTENYRIGIGKSGIHGWGLFARQDIREGEMIFEYRGELLRPIVADRREAQYQVEGKHCYFFKISKDVVVDATNKGSMGRLINHSCMPNCFARIINVSQDKSRIIIFAKKDLAAGDELTYDYMFDPDEKGDQRVPCLCKAPNCKKFMN